MVEENTIQNLPCNKLWVRLLCAFIILASGIAIGVGGTILMVKHRVIWISRMPKDANDITEMVTKKYDLNPQQIEQVRKIITNSFEQRKLDDEAQSAKRDIYAKQITAEMNSVLTPEQFEKWNKDFQEMRERYKKRTKK
ncbi:MAG: hypothetical protein A2Y10_16610 [Planctomycetes bacterium GWF2_41_51]|nr:MAG: hypothetical protein A2Y10_16610 [Planctomycetes bacterium GWF2_41_51]HBG28911.1 hypothetical protein [Phycisphaerales bacterium]